VIFFDPSFPPIFEETLLPAKRLLFFTGGVQSIVKTKTKVWSLDSHDSRKAL